ncbi:pectinesterase [Filimonas zeae]|uniref:pectinesterase family protein n=1 Tax=Filimonas zeae TaxID=1737353 RepID=UPI0016684EC5|nr:pectinesterase family protein [Filimonas zeae]MDR6339536.1 pectinesterase [Filimonas zeae]
MFLLKAVVALACIFSSGTAKQKQIVVAQDGSGQYTTIQQAINAAPSNSVEPVVIFIKKGNYSTEKLIIPADKKQLKLLGESREQTIISYAIYDCNSPASQNKCPDTLWQKWKDNKELIRTSATLTIVADEVVVENLTVKNTAGNVGQALALTLRGDKIIFRNCIITGYQDTVLLAEDGKRNYFENCYILGRTDYIYGGGIGFFEQCEIASFGGGWITAPSTKASQPYGFVFNNCRFTFVKGSPNIKDDSRPVALGRPWHNYPKVAILNSDLCSQIDPKGWPTTWHMDYAATSDSLQLVEYANSGAGADFSQRASWAGIKQLTKAQAENYTLQKVLGGKDGWKP